MNEDLNPVILRRSSSSQSNSYADSTIHNSFHFTHDVNASALSVDATGSVAVLAARKGLYVVDLESPYQVARTLHHQTKWDVTVVKCNPHVPYKGLVASTSNHNTLLWNIDHNTSTHIGVLSSHQPLMSTLRAHTRPVSDVAWSPSEPTVLATCSADTKTHLWDIRTPQKPAQSLCAFTTSATQVEWNRLDSFSLATAHDGEVRIWDTRSCEKPTVIITAHMQKIYGLDWSPTNVYELVTCSEDKTVKFWNVTRPRVCQGVVATGAPVWRARYTPFGDGLVTSFHRQEFILRLWSLSRDTTMIDPKPVYDFIGHKDLIKGFAWRQGINQIFQLISWSKNQELRMWKMETSQLELCGYINPLRYGGIQQQLSIVEDYDIIDDTIDILTIPNNEIPLITTSRSINNYKFDLSGLKNDFIPLILPSSTIYHSTVTHHDIEWKIEEWNTIPELLNNNNSTLLLNNKINDIYLKREPIQRVSGGCFSGPNCLVTFDSRVVIGKSKILHSRPLNVKDDGNWNDDLLNIELIEIENQQINEQKQTKPYVENQHALNLRVHILDCTVLSGQMKHILTNSIDLRANNAVHNGDIELNQLWSILSISCNNELNENNLISKPWYTHPFGCNLIQNIFELYENAGDVSTLAAIACALNDTLLLKNTKKEYQRYDGYKKAYGELLYRQGEMNIRCGMLKHLHSIPESHVGLTLALYCHRCSRPSSELYCEHCKDFSIKCSVCEQVVRGQSMFCMNCGHGGHSNHIIDWFSLENACPTGCGCYCKQVPGPMEFQTPITPPHLARSYSF